MAGHYAERGVTLSPEEIFISDGAKSDLGNLLDLFDADNTVLIPDPVYPAYVDANVMAGRRVRYVDATPDNGFLPLPDADLDADLVYICSPNNPTGAVYDHAGLAAWVDYALRRGALLLFDAAYEAFVSDPALPRTIYEVEGARSCAIEICSLSKTAGFTGTRCGYTIVPRELNRRHEPERHVAAPPEHQVQRRALHRPARRRGGLHPGGLVPVHGVHRLLPPKTRASSPARWTSWASSTRAASTRPTSGCAARAALTPGRSSTCCWRRPTSWARPGAGFGVTARASSA